MLRVPFGTSFAYRPGDSDDVRSEKAAIFIVATACCVAGAAWAVMYLFAFGAGLTAALPLIFTILVGSALLYGHVSGNHRVVIYGQIVCIIYVTTVIQWTIGDAVDSGFVMAWALIGPLIALMFLPVRQAILWQGLFVLNVAISAIFSDYFAAHGLSVDPGWRTFFFAMNLGIASIVIFAFATYFVRNALTEKGKADALLLNILPTRIARTLKTREGVIAEDFDRVSVLFADIVDYTRYSSSRAPTEVVAKLDEIFHRFDALTERYGLEKIKTIGDAYMVVSGLPERRERPECAIAEMALDMVEAAREVEGDAGRSFLLRVGIHFGPVVAGVIGRSRIAYDLWGDTVNVASRLESSSVPDRIQVSDILFEKLKDDFTFERRGAIPLKGKGEMETYFLTGRLNVSA